MQNLIKTQTKSTLQNPSAQKESAQKKIYSAKKNCAKKICFICMGNICRSPLAEGIARHLYAKQIKSNPKSSTKSNTDSPQSPTLEFSSAGTSGFHNGDSIDSRSIAIAKKHGIDISHYKSKQVSPYSHSDIDLFVAMDRQNYASLLQFGFDREKVALLGDFGLNGKEVPDPYYGGSEGFIKVYEMLEAGITNMLKELQK